MSERLPGPLRGEFEERKYQLNMFDEVRDHNSLVVLPTALGKTMIAVFLVADKIENSDGHVFFLAPSKPLVEQHTETLREHLDADVRVVTGETHGPDERSEAWKDGRVTAATPQTLWNDVKEGRIDLGDCPLIVFDEAHRATGDYAYVPICRHHLDTSTRPQVLGLTASPGSDLDRLAEVALNLGLEKVSVRTEMSEDVKPYVGEKELERIEVKKTDLISRGEKNLNRILKDFLGDLSKYSGKARGLDPQKASPKVLKEVMGELQARLQQSKKGYLYHAVSLCSAAMKLIHLKGLLTTQGLEVAQNFMWNLKDEDTRASSLFLNHDEAKKLRKLMEEVEESHNPKLKKVVEVLQRHFCGRPRGRAMVFAEYRDTVDFLTGKLNEYPNMAAEKFIGQAGSEGMTQKEQKEILERFDKGEFDTLVSTSIGEEGIDVPSTSLVVFYEPVPSAIRRIQRKGRTARDGRKGEIKVLVMEGTRDEPYYWKSLRGEKKMYKEAYRLKEILGESLDPVQKLHGLTNSKQADLDRWSAQN